MNRARGQSEASRAKISTSLSGLTAERSRRWVGDDVGYMGVHHRAKKVLPLECAAADDTCRGRLEVALRADAVGPFKTSHRGVRFSVRTDDYERLCCSHHRRRDGNIPRRSAA